MHRSRSRANNCFFYLGTGSRARLASVNPPAVLIALDTSAAWSRGIVEGFVRCAREHGWSMLYYPSDADLPRLMTQWRPRAAVLGPAFAGPWPRDTRTCLLVSVNADHCQRGIASVCIDEQKVAELALTHLRDRGFRAVTVFRFGGYPFAALRERHFAEAASRAGMRLEPGWAPPDAIPCSEREDPAAIKRWLRDLPKPCGIFVCCDAWASIVARHARAANLRVPEDLALIGVDNDEFECELMSPPLASVAVPWHGIGETTARLVSEGLRGKIIWGKRVVIPPLDVVSRRSTDGLAIDDPVVAAAVQWIRTHAARRITVPMVAEAARVPRYRLERQFRGALGRTVMEEVRRAHVEIAKRLLVTTDLLLPQVAESSGFTTAALLHVAFRRETGMSPGAYRRSARSLPASSG
jgi:LacI family transcriptional regulator